MIPTLVVAALLLTASSGLWAVAFGRAPALAQRLACVAMCLGAIVGVVAAAAALLAPSPPVLALPWSVPGGTFALRLDGLSAFFLCPVLIVPALGSIYGISYFPQARLGAKAVRLQLFYGLITGSMALVVVAANAILFLAAWEVMALAGFFLVLTDHKEREAQRAALVYLAAAHAGNLALFAMFALLGRMAGSYDFSAMAGLAAVGGAATATVALALCGFGMKAGVLPLHFWLPGAHAAAPSHVSALMSGVLLKTGIYGLLRVAGFFQGPPAAWGTVMLVLGGVSAVLGVAFALAQHDVKRLLAYHSVENIGIIAMGIGLALLGRARGDAALVFLGFAAAVLHTVNHATFKALLFLGAGAVIHATGTRDLDHLGGLSRAMPRTAALFLVGAAAICGLPPLNGFASEWLVYLASLRTVFDPGRPRTRTSPRWRPRCWRWSGAWQRPASSRCSAPPSSATHARTTPSTLTRPPRPCWRPCWCWPRSACSSASSRLRSSPGWPAPPRTGPGSRPRRWPPPPPPRGLPQCA